MSAAARHQSVMLPEALAMLDVQPGGRYLDATVGLGGHAEAILDAAAPNGRLLGVDADPDAVAAATRRLERFGARAVLARCWLDQVAQAAADADLAPLDGILCDLGVSSLQLDTPERGFSFRADGPLDMRLGPADESPAVTADEIVNGWPADDLADLIREYGEDRRARRIARGIVEHRPIRSTQALAQAVVDSVSVRPGARIHPATRIFQAIRLEVNRELERLDAFLSQARGLLRLGGRLVVIAFHSLEDRIVKGFLRERSSGAEPSFRALTRRVLRPSAEEVARNPRARSARLRAAEAV